MTAKVRGLVIEVFVSIDSVLLNSGRENCVPTILRIITQSLVAFVSRGKSLKLRLKFAFELMEIS